MLDQQKYAFDEFEEINTRLSIPEHIIKKVLKNFGADEAIAWVFNTWWTALLSAWARETLSQTQKSLLYTIGWPVIEKFWLFARHIWQACKLRQDTPYHERKSPIFYFKQIAKWWWESLLKDVLIHDPLYWMLMYACLQSHTNASSLWITAYSVWSFILAIGWVALLERGYDETKYAILKKNLEQAWFLKDAYYQSKLEMTTQIYTAEEIFDCLNDRFNLTDYFQRNYSDEYIESKNEMYWWKYIHLRKRQVTSPTTWENRCASELVLTKPDIIRLNGLHELNYFYMEKEKWTFGDNLDDNLLAPRKSKNEQNEIITFDRTVSRNAQWLYVAHDTNHDKNNGIELKVHHHNKKLLVWAITILKKHFPWLVQSTITKKESRWKY